MTRSSTRKRFGLVGGAAFASTLLAGGLLASTAAAQTPPGTGWGPGNGPRQGGPGPRAAMVRPGAGPVVGPGAEHEAVAQALGITSDELYALRAEGKSMAQIAEEKGVPLATVTDAMLQAHKAWLDQRVADGTLTQAQADAMLSVMTARIEANVQATGVGPRGGMMGQRGGRGPGMGPGAGLETGPGYGPRFSPGTGPGVGPRWGQPTS